MSDSKRVSEAIAREARLLQTGGSSFTGRSRSISISISGGRRRRRRRLRIPVLISISVSVRRLRRRRFITSSFRGGSGTR